MRAQAMEMGTVTWLTIKIISRKIYLTVAYLCEDGVIINIIYLKQYYVKLNKTI